MKEKNQSQEVLGVEQQPYKKKKKKKEGGHELGCDT